MPVIVVTGASHGIGAAIAQAFASEPNSKIALVARTEEKLKRVAKACGEAGATTRIFASDLTDTAQTTEMASAVLDEWGSPSVLINNAGLFQPGSIQETTHELFREQIDANLMTAFNATAAFINPMIEAGGGDVFFMGSVASIRGYPSSVSYCASKHAVLGLARAVREETKDKGIRVITLLPGATLTPSWDGVEVPTERFMPAEDIARIALSAHKMSGRSVIEEILVRPQLGDL